jgi:hypothetical protein
MSESTTFTQEFRSWEWELVLKYEDGSLPRRLERRHADDDRHVVREEPDARAGDDALRAALPRNRHRLMHRLSEAAVATDSIESLDACGSRC